MKTNETISNVKANNVNNESATAKVENESKQILIDVTLESDTYKIKHANEINKRYKSEQPQQHESDNWQHGKLIAIYRPISDRKNSDKTFYKVEFNGITFDGYTNTEFCDANGIPRTHRGSNTPKVATMLDKLQALKAAIEAVESNESDFVNFAKIVAQKIESEKLESDRSAFVAKYNTLISALPYLTTAVATTLHGEDFVKMALKLGYKFADTKATTATATESK